MSLLLLPVSERHAVERAALDSYPEECCGILVGAVVERGARVSEAIAVPNVSREAGRRYRIDDRVLLAAHKEARSRGLEVVGYYHSHPDRPAVPSALDRERAHAGVSYLIVSVREGRVEGLASWRLREGGEGFREEPIESPA